MKKLKQLPSSNELLYSDLKVICNPNIFKFETTADLEPIRSGIGQDRGITALKFRIKC